MSFNAAFYCVGEIMEEYGSQVMSLIVELAPLAVNTHNTSDTLTYISSLGLEACLLSLSFTLSKPSTRRSLPQATHYNHENIFKYMRFVLSDKALAVQCAAGEVSRCTLLHFPTSTHSCSFWSRYTRRIEHIPFTRRRSLPWKEVTRES